MTADLNEQARTIIGLPAGLEIHPVARIRGRRIWFLGPHDLKRKGGAFVPFVIGLVFGAITALPWMQAGTPLAGKIVVLLFFAPGALLFFWLAGRELWRLNRPRNPLTYILDFDRRTITVSGESNRDPVATHHFSDIYLWVTAGGDHADGPEANKTLSLTSPHPDAWRYEALGSPKFRFTLCHTFRDPEALSLGLKRLKSYGPWKGTVDDVGVMKLLAQEIQ
jgi:hypothetical protein